MSTPKPSENTKSATEKIVQPAPKPTASENKKKHSSPSKSDNLAETDEEMLDFESLVDGDSVPNLTKTMLNSLAESSYRLTVNAGSEIPVESPINPLFAERGPVLQAFRDCLRGAKLDVLEGRLEEPIQVAECGVYRGRCTRALFEVAEEIGIEIQITGLDTFSGLPKLSEKDLEYAPPKAKYRRQKVFSDTTQSEVLAYIGKKYTKKLQLVEGDFSKTLSSLDKARKYSFVFIDCDLYEGHKSALEYFYSKMNPGGIIFLDDYFSKEYPMARVAVDEFLEDKKEEVFEVRYGPYPWSVRKGFIVRN